MGNNTKRNPPNIYYFVFTCTQITLMPNINTAVEAYLTYKNINLCNEMNYDVYHHSCIACIFLTFLTIILGDTKFLHDGLWF